MDLLIGGLAGMGATIFSNPMDVVKTRMQLQGELKARHQQTTKYRNILQAFYVIGRNDGILALQKGLVPAMLVGFCMNSVRLGVYSFAEGKGWTRGEGDKLSMSRAIFWSGASGLLSGVTGNPAFVLKTRIQSIAHPSIAVGRQHKYNGALDGVIQIYKIDGVKGFFVGVKATCARITIGSAAQLSSFTAIKDYLRSDEYFAKSPVALATVASLGSGVICLMFETPLDVVNTRLVNQGSAKSGTLLYSGFLDCLTKTFKAEGVHGLYKGLGPLYLRMAPHTTISLVIWDTLNNLLNDT